MKGKAFLGATVLIAMLLACAGAGAAAPPNFIIFYMDDLGWADTSVAMMDGEPLSKSDSKA